MVSTGRERPRQAGTSSMVFQSYAIWPHMRLHLIAGRHSPLATELQLPVAEAPAGIAWQTQRPLVIPDIDRESRFPRLLEILRDEGMQFHRVRQRSLTGT